MTSSTGTGTGTGMKDDPWQPTTRPVPRRFGTYLPPLPESLGLAEVTYDAKNTRMRAS
jgi:hypothetical protein